MSYLGTGVTQGTVELDSFTGNGSTTDFTLTRAPVGVDGLLVSLDGVVQDPGEWSLSGTTLSFSTAPHSSGDIRVWNLAISASAISDDAITLAKMAGGTDGNIISYDASGNPVAIATGDDGQVLTSAGAGAPPAFEAAGGGIERVSIFRLTTSFTGAAGSGITSNWEEADTYGYGKGDAAAAVTESSGIFTFAATGVYLVYFHVEAYGATDHGTTYGNIRVTTDSGKQLL